jgi:hypothetical protein
MDIYMSRVVYDSSKYYEEKAKLSESDGFHCIICGILFDKPDKRRSYCSQGCFSKWYNSIGINSWSELRERVLKRDGKCIRCGILIGVFEVHHIKPISEGGNEFDPNNCMTLCYDCHKDMHTLNGKKKRLNHCLDEFVTNNV